jgi:signal transduction histidine kinase
VFTPSGLSGGTILIAEDEPRLAESIAQLLCERYTVVVALDGVTAVELLKRHQPQLLITDVDMPGMSGIELAKRFRELTGDRLAPIIILSAVIDLGTRLAGLEAGAVDYVGKPFEPKELQARVDAQFRMRDLAVRLHRAEQLSALGILTSGLAHELRNPANGIVNALEPLRELLPPELLEPNSAVAELFEAMKASADQMWFLVNQLLGFRSNSALELRSVELPDLVRRAVRLANGALEGVTVRLDLANAGTLMCAPPLMVQVLTNLVENAGDAAGRGGWVEVQTGLHKGIITIEVTDSGPGVPVELRERIFEPFFTTKDPKPGTGGTGLGLSVARTIIHRHRGTLEVRSRGDRTAFVIELPANSNMVQAVSAV